MRMLSPTRLLSTVAALSLLAAILAGQTPPQTQVSLLADQSAVAPGSQVWVGIHFQMEPGWHIYWLNPGDAGQPPSVQWALPAGWTAGAIEWPTPERLTNPAGVDYGYNGEATLLTKVKVPATAKPGPADLNADLKWLVCKEMCIPQKGEAKLTLQVASKSVPDAAGKQQIAAVRAKLPKPLPADWKANVQSNPRQFLLNFMPGAKVDTAEFFPAEPQVIENAAVQKLSATSVRAQLALDKGDAAVKATNLKGVLVLNGTDAYTLTVPIKR
jgi:DsbC/DsbD-like thiol-disulfide interchange protein